MTYLSEHLSRYLALRRALGYQLNEHGRLLPSFVSYLEKAGEQTMTVKAAQAWANETGPASASRLMSVVRGFAMYMSAFDEATEIPPSRIAPAETNRKRPYLFTDEQVGALLEAARSLSPKPWAATMATLIGLLAATGIRPGEAYRLDRADVDLGTGELSVLNSKFGRSRILPLHSTTVKALRRYSTERDRARPTERAFFLTRRGLRIKDGQASTAFRELLVAASITAPVGWRQPRLYDFRHRFAVNTLVDWHRRGVDVQRQLPVLSAYLGHLVPGNTYWYFEAAPELLGVVGGRMSSCFEDEQ